MKLSIIVPCYNEAKNIPLILNRFAEVMIPESELILVNNGSNDGSDKVFEEELKKPTYKFAKTVHVKKNLGYGHGILSGLKEAKGSFLAWTHADMQTDPEDVIKAYKNLLKSTDPENTVVKGKRVNRGLSETLFTLGMSIIASLVLGKLLFDINAQPKVFSREFYKKMKNPPEDFSLDLYWFYLAKKEGVKIQTINVNFGKRIHGESKWAFSFKSKVKTILRTIKYIFALRKSLNKKLS